MAGISVRWLYVYAISIEYTMPSHCKAVVHQAAIALHIARNHGSRRTAAASRIIGINYYSDNSTIFTLAANGATPQYL